MKTKTLLTLFSAGTAALFLGLSTTSASQAQSTSSTASTTARTTSSSAATNAAIYSSTASSNAAANARRYAAMQAAMRASALRASAVASQEDLSMLYDYQIGPAQNIEAYEVGPLLSGEDYKFEQAPVPYSVGQPK